jgi:glycerophosphoryl diester phosphodiesterase
VERYGLQDQVILSSFNHFSLRRLRKCRPYWKLGALYDFGLYKPWIYARWLLGVSAIHPVHFVATDSIIKKCHQHEIAVRPYTVDEPQEMKRLLAAEVDAIITNVPDQLLQIIR